MKKRSIGLAILFTIITGGIYGIYWFVKLTNDSNTINPEHKTAGGGLAFFLSIITCGIYMLYWANKLGKKLTGKGTGYLLLTLFGLGIVAWCLAQSEINKKIDAGVVGEVANTADDANADAE